MKDMRNSWLRQDQYEINIFWLFLYENREYEDFDDFAGSWLTQESSQNVWKSSVSLLRVISRHFQKKQAQKIAYNRIVNKAYEVLVEYNDQGLQLVP